MIAMYMPVDLDVRASRLTARGYVAISDILDVCFTHLDQPARRGLTHLSAKHLLALATQSVGARATATAQQMLAQHLLSTFGRACQTCGFGS